MNRWPLYILFGLLSMSCSAPQVPLVVAHRGASFDAPENTLAAFRLAWEDGADAIEGDFYLTADAQIVCVHDATFKRTAGLDRKPSEMTLAEIRTLDAGSWKHARFVGEGVPTLSEVLGTVPHGKRILIEVKCGPEILLKLKETIDTSALKQDQFRLISFNANVITESKRLMPSLRAYWLTGFKKAEDGRKTPDVSSILATLRSCSADGLDAHADMEVVNESFVAAFREAGYELHFWTVDDPAVARRLAELGADSITTNRPGLIRNTLRP